MVQQDQPVKVKLTQLSYGAGEQEKEERQEVASVSSPLHVFASEHAIFVPGVSKAVRDTYKADPDMGDSASPLVHLPAKGRETSQLPTAGRQPADSTPSACSVRDDASGLSLYPRGGSVSDSASCLPGPASSLSLALDESRCFSAHLHRCLDAGCGQLSAFCSVIPVLSPQMQPCC